MKNNLLLLSSINGIEEQTKTLFSMLTAVIIAVLIAIVYFIIRRVKNRKKGTSILSDISNEELERIKKIKGRCEVLNGIDFEALDEWVIVGVFDELNRFGNRKDNYRDSLTEISFAGYQDSETPTEAQLNLICYFYNNQKAVLEKICEGIKKEYPKLMELYDVKSFNVEYGFPEIKSNDDIRKIIDIQSIGITQEDEGSSLLTFWGNCTWDEEHGFGIVMNQEEVLKVGDADEAIVLW